MGTKAQGNVVWLRRTKTVFLVGLSARAALFLAALAGCGDESESGAGTVGSGGSGGQLACVPKTCAELDAECGKVPDGCDGVLSCGTCGSGETCGAAGPNQCGTGTCTPQTCAEAGGECGLLGDGCGEVIDCGGCPMGQSCGVEEPNRCGEGGSGGSGGATGGAGGATGGSGGATGGSGGSVSVTCHPDFAVTVDVQHESSLHTASGTIWYLTTQIDQLSSNKRGAMASSSCGDLGMVYRTVDPDKCDVVYARFTQDGLQDRSIVLSGTSAYSCPTDLALFYDAGCAPQVIMPGGSTGLSQYSLDAQNQWQATAITLAPLNDHYVSALLGLVHGRDGKVHLLLRGTQSGTGERIVHGTLGATGWSFASLPAITFNNVHEQHGSYPYNVLFNFAVDSQGVVHGVFNNDGELGYAESSSGSWNQQIVIPQADSRNNTGFEAHIAIDANDQPAIAAATSQHHGGWSIMWLKLYYYSRDAGGAWNAELISDQADGFVGGDGNNYSGHQTQLFFDGFGQPYVVFSDLASWHIGYNYRAPGQIRYAIKACDQWHYHTVFHQDGQTVSPNPINECRHPMMTLGQDGQTMLFACMERNIQSALGAQDTDSPALTSTLRAFVASQQMD